MRRRVELSRDEADRFETFVKSYDGAKNYQRMDERDGKSIIVARVKMLDAFESGVKKRAAKRKTSKKKS